MLIASLTIVSAAGAFNLLAIFSPNQCEIDRTCCKDLGLGINKICEKPATQQLVSNPFSANELYYDVKSDSHQTVFHYPGSIFFTTDFIDRQGKDVALDTTNKLMYGLIACGGNTNPQFSGWNLYVTNPTANSCGYISQENEIISDRYNYIDNQYTKNLGTGEVSLFNKWYVTPSTYAWQTDIDGQFCGERFTVITTQGIYEFTNVIDPCPTRVVENGGGKFTVYFNNHPQNTIKQYKSILTLTKVNGQDLGTEVGISDWILNFDAMRQGVKDEFEGFMRGFKYPAGKSNDEKLDYYRFLLNIWMGAHKPVSDSLTNNKLVVGGKAKYYLSPNLATYTTGMWIWDSALTLQGGVSALDGSSPLFNSIINDVLDVQAGNNPSYPNNQPWHCELHPDSFGLCYAQPTELYIPVILGAYNKGIVAQSKLCSQMYPILKSNYYYYKQKAGSSFMFSTQGGYGRDGTTLLSGTTASSDSVSGYALMAKGMSKISEICGLSSDKAVYDSDYNSIKTAFEKLWREDKGIYWNLDGSGSYKDGSTNNIGATPYGVCLAIVTGLVPSNRIERIFNVLEQNYVDGYSAFPDTGVGYTSVPKTASFYDPASQWNGGSWDWADNTICYNAISKAISEYGLTNLQPVKDRIAKRNMNMFGYYSIYMMESYNSATGQLSSWSSRPYMAAGNIMGAIEGNNNLYATLGASSPPPACVPSVEVCDGLDNDCDSVIDNGVSIQCMDYSSCAMKKICGSSCMSVPTEICDGIDNNCDGTVDEGCNCVNGQTKQCGTSSVGECKLGFQTCSSGKWQACQGNVEPVNETADGKDNDCDGFVDEDYQCLGVQNPDCYRDKGMGWFMDFIIWIVNLIKSLKPQW